ncbi:putative autophagocytosis associated protein [Trypanosoma theileri]|uniref:Putative autophagocytosis associated protein n=1 Tax=Trypanosoma theileri TaxID=67003 RepID=A0A1X0P139_9TRYP|nr:putative autophagocytosis associated protein [Trypanosoma theileri]ORC90654.1 putative autophagocytosis associated protein [Trypanosoma theileri]
MNKRNFYENFKKIYNHVQGVKTVTNFQATGTLTPLEFVEAGDELVQKMPVWAWAEGDEKIQPFLPPKKKYLVYRGAPSYERAPDIEHVKDNEIEGDDGWVTTHASHKSSNVASSVPEKVINWDEEDEDEEKDQDQADDTEERRCRLYDVYMVYDQYYQTPRIFLIGYAEDHTTLLTKEEMMQDVYASNREKTVSIDPHPFLKAACISIHPCRHAETMKRLLQHMKRRFEASQPSDKEKEEFIFPTHMALFLFLKFVSSVIPSIEYDLSIGIDI